MKIRIRKANQHAWVCVSSLLGLSREECNALRDYIDELRQQACWNLAESQPSIADQSLKQ